MSTFDPTARVNAIFAHAEQAKRLIDTRASREIEALFDQSGAVVDFTRKSHEIRENARKRKLALHEAAIASINEIWAQWNEAELKERKRRARK